MDPTGVTEGAKSKIASRPQNLDGAVVGLLWKRKAQRRQTPQISGQSSGTRASGQESAVSVGGRVR